MASTSINMYGVSDAESKNKKVYKRFVFTFIITACIVLITFSFFKQDKLIESFCGIEEMYNDPFYLELSSNATSFGNNTVANFRNDISLLRPLEGYWEAALVEISYTKSWKNVRDDYKMCLENETKLINIQEPDTIINYAPDNKNSRCGFIRSGHYDSLHELIEEINNELFSFSTFKMESIPELKFDHVTKLVRIKPGLDSSSALIFPTLNDELSAILGFENYTTVNPKMNSKYQLIGDRPADLNAGLHTLFVYADFVEPQYIGDTRAKLLRAVEVPNYLSYGDQIVVKYEDPHYVPVLTNDFEHIEIDIKDDTNTRIPFMYGRSRMKIHFRKKK